MDDEYWHEPEDIRYDLESSPDLDWNEYDTCYDEAEAETTWYQDEDENPYDVAEYDDDVFMKVGFSYKKNETKRVTSFLILDAELNIYVLG